MAILVAWHLHLVGEFVFKLSSNMEAITRHLGYHISLIGSHPISLDESVLFLGESEGRANIRR